MWMDMHEFYSFRLIYQFVRNAARAVLKTTDIASRWMYIGDMAALFCVHNIAAHNSDVIMRAMASQITSLPLFTQPLIQAQIKDNIKLCVTGLCDGNSPVTGEFPAQRASNPEKMFPFDGAIMNKSYHNSICDVTTGHIVDCSFPRISISLMF